jgi:2-polyprenyl-6-methoxyphenol hydroxylase-like FAD-dependent oxidoreductase
VPAHKISLGKKVRTVEKEGRVRIHCSDNSTHEADILVGTDGAYSSVRQSLFKRLEAEDRLSKSDTENLTIASINMVGVAVPPDPSKYPQLKDQFGHFSVIIGGSGSRSVSSKWKKMEELSEESRHRV